MNFEGRQSLNGIQTFDLFTAPAAGIYFVSGKLSLPQLGTAGGASEVIVTVYNGIDDIYVGEAGASGFEVNQILCAADDVITVKLDSSADPDLVLNAVSGQVVFGNTF